MHQTFFSVNLFQPVTKEKGKNIRRTNSLETLSSSYINGQWPRENNTTTHPTATGSTALCKSTQVNIFFVLNLIQCSYIHPGFQILFILANLANLKFSTK